MTGEFGMSNAGKAWLRRVEPLTSARPDPALIPARRIARQSTRAIEVSGNAVHVVLADRQRQYEITLAVPAWDKRETSVAADILQKARLAPLDDLPDTLLNHLREHQVDLTPRLEQIEVQPTSAARRHTLAALYRLIQLLDEEPQRALTLRTAHARAEESDRVESLWVPLADLNAAHFYSRPR
ncbi:MAG: hypothetical protein LCH76_10035 [Actinobacteria bacterium]|nr:hypothetical protein [Actinomycetota bacterium]